MSKMIESNETFAAIFTDMLEERPANSDMPGNYVLCFKAHRKDNGNPVPGDIRTTIGAESLDKAIEEASRTLNRDYVYYLITADWMHIRNLMASIQFSPPSTVRHPGYKEVKNYIHNEMGITRSEIMEIFATIAKDEMQEVIGEENDFIKSFIRSSVRTILREEMLNVVNNGRYQQGPFSVREDNFNKFISNAMKEEISKMLREQFDVGIQIEEKERPEE